MSTSQQPQEQQARVFLDPDGSGGDILGVIVECKTGVIYGAQCEGVRTDERYAEGYFVPISGLMFDAEDGRINFEMLRKVFHVGEVCLHGGGEFDPLEHAGSLQNAISKVPFWDSDGAGETRRSKLELDTSRLAEAVESWVPVLTPRGPGILVWPNCD